MTGIVARMIHRFDIRVYYEDTDLAGIVYYANYLRFIERGRSEMLRAAGIDQLRIKDETGIVFAVRRLTAEYLAPATLDDILEVTTEPLEITGARIVLRQGVSRDQTPLFKADVTLAALQDNGRPGRIPAELRQAFRL